MHASSKVICPLCEGTLPVFSTLAQLSSGRPIVHDLCGRKSKSEFFVEILGDALLFSSESLFMHILSLCIDLAG